MVELSVFLIKQKTAYEVRISDWSADVCSSDLWQFQGRETWTMIGYHAVPVIADAYMKGIKCFDAKAALDTMVASATYGPYGDLKDYMELGYVSTDKEPGAASPKSEYASDTWQIEQMAQKKGETKTTERSQ